MNAPFLGFLGLVSCIKFKKLLQRWYKDHDKFTENIGIS